MVAVKLLGITAAFYFFIVREGFAYNSFSPKYGKQIDGDIPERFLAGRRLGRSNEQNSIGNREIRFFLSGGRYGKRGCTEEKCLEESKEIAITGFDNSNPDDKIIMPVRRNQFKVGSRFGKRLEDTIEEPKELKNPWCAFASDKNYYNCFTGTQSKLDFPNSDYNNQVFE